MAAHFLIGVSQRHIRGPTPLTLRTQRLRNSGPERQASERASHALSAFAESASAAVPPGPVLVGRAQPPSPSLSSRETPHSFPLPPTGQTRSRRH